MSDVDDKIDLLHALELGRGTVESLREDIGGGTSKVHIARLLEEMKREGLVKLVLKDRKPVWMLVKRPRQETQGNQRRQA